jgi:hypothetical protein
MRRCVLLGAMVVGLCLSAEEAMAKASQDASLERLLDAIAIVESQSNPDAIGDKGRAIGSYQIHKRYWADGTRILGVDWQYREAKDPAKARKVVRAYLIHYGRNKSILQKARIHNGGPRGYRKEATLAYARKIAKVLQKEEDTSS